MPNGVSAAAVVPPGAVAPTTAGRLDVPAVDWVEATDTPSGITVELPGEVEPVEFAGSPCRDYSAETTDPHVGVLFTVCDAQETPKMSDLHTAAAGSTSGFRKGSGNVAVKSTTRETEFDGHPTLDLRLSTKDGGPDSSVGAYRYIADDSHFIMVQTVADARNEKSLNAIHKRVITEMHIPD